MNVIEIHVIRAILKRKLFCDRRLRNDAGVDSIEDTSLFGGAQLLEGGIAHTAAWPRKSVQQVWD